MPKERYQVVTLSVKIKSVPRGLTEEQIQRLAERIEKTVKGRSSREVSVGCP